MPNYCINSLEVSADVKDIQSLKQFEDFVKTSIIEDGERFTFNGVVPMPKELDIPSRFPKTKELEELENANIEKYGHPNWYDWRCEKWGTKWDAIDTYLNSEIHNDYVMITFDTAWSPPLSYYEALTMKYPLLTIDVQYEECGMDFAGEISYYDGEVQSEEEYTYNMYEWLYNKDSWWDNLYYQFEEDEDMKTLQDFKDHHGEIWELMNETDKDDVRDIIKQTQNQEV